MHMVLRGAYASISKLTPCQGVSRNLSRKPSRGHGVLLTMSSPLKQEEDAYETPPGILHNYFKYVRLVYDKVGIFLK